MRKLLYSMMTVALLASCDIETSDNGQLDGFWQLNQVDTLATGGTTDMHESMVYWAFQNKLLEISHLTNVEGRGDNYFFRFHRDGTSLLISSPYHHLWREPDEPVEYVDVLRPLGINQLEEDFHLDMLDDDILMMNNNVLRLTFVKY